MATTDRPDPQPREFWATSKGRTVEILARDEVVQHGNWELDYREVDTVAYKFLGGSQVHLRAVDSLIGWTKVEFE